MQITIHSGSNRETRFYSLPGSSFAQLRRGLLLTAHFAAWLGLGVLTAQGSARTWTGLGGDGLWSNPTNWTMVTTNYTLPEFDDDVAIATPAGTTILGDANTAVLRSLTVTGEGMFQINDDRTFTVTTDATFDSRVTVLGRLITGQASFSKQTLISGGSLTINQKAVFDPGDNSTVLILENDGLQSVGMGGVFEVRSGVVHLDGNLNLGGCQFRLGSSNVTQHMPEMLIYGGERILGAGGGAFINYGDIRLQTLGTAPFSFDIVFKHAGGLIEAPSGSGGFTFKQSLEVNGGDFDAVDAITFENQVLYRNSNSDFRFSTGRYVFKNSLVVGANLATHNFQLDGAQVSFATNGGPYQFSVGKGETLLTPAMAGTLYWISGFFTNMNGCLFIQTNSEVRLEGTTNVWVSARRTLACPAENHGKILFTEEDKAGISLLAKMTNGASGIIEFRGPTGFPYSAYYPTSGAIINEGLIRKLAPTHSGAVDGTNALSSQLTNTVSGRVQIASGTLSLLGGHNYGSIEVASNVMTEINGTFQIETNSTFTTGLPGLVVRGRLNTYLPLDLSGLILAGELDGSAPITVSHDFEWSSGLITGSSTLTVAGEHATMTLGTGLTLRGNRVLHLAGGGSTTSSTALIVLDKAQFIVETNGLLLISHGGTFGSLLPPGVFRNRGRMVLDMPGTLTWLSGLVNEGVVKVVSGQLHFWGGTVTGGEFQLDAGARLTTVYNPRFKDVDVSGPGFMEVTNLTYFDGTCSVDNFRVGFPGQKLASSTSLPSVTGVLHIFDTMEWHSGKLNCASGRIEIGSLAEWRIENATDGNIMELAGPVVNHGHILYSATGRNVLADHSKCVITNMPGAEFAIDGSGFVFDDTGVSMPFHNQGRVVVAAGAGPLGFGPRMENSGTVTLNGGTLIADAPFRQLAGETMLDGGALEVNGGLQITGGKLKGRGNIKGNVTNTSGIIDPGLPIGELAIDGDFTQQTGGTTVMNLDDRRSSARDFIRVTGHATFGGNIALQVGPFFDPQPDEEVDLMRHGSSAGFVDSFLTAGVPANLAVAPVYYNKFLSIVFRTISSQVDLAVNVAAVTDPVPVNSNLTYTVTVANLSATNATGVVATNPLPPAVTLGIVQVSQGTYTNDNGLLRFTLGALDPGASATIRITLAPTNATALTNRIGAYCLQAETAYTNNAVEWITLVQSSAAGPHLSAPAFDPATGFRLRLIADPGTLVRLQYSTDLSAWWDLGFTNAPGGELELTDPAATNHAFRFYRIMAGP